MPSWLRQIITFGCSACISLACAFQSVRYWVVSVLYFKSALYFKRVVECIVLQEYFVLHGGGSVLYFKSVNLDTLWQLCGWPHTLIIRTAVRYWLLSQQYGNQAILEAPKGVLLWLEACSPQSGKSSSSSQQLVETGQQLYISHLLTNSMYLFLFFSLTFSFYWC